MKENVIAKRKSMERFSICSKRLQVKCQAWNRSACNLSDVLHKPWIINNYSLGWE